MQIPSTLQWCDAFFSIPGEEERDAANVPPHGNRPSRDSSSLWVNVCALYPILSFFLLFSRVRAHLGVLVRFVFSASPFHRRAYIFSAKRQLYDVAVRLYSIPLASMPIMSPVRTFLRSVIVLISVFRKILFFRKLVDNALSRHIQRQHPFTITHVCVEK